MSKVEREMEKEKEEGIAEEKKGMGEWKNIIIRSTNTNVKRRQ